MTNQTIRPLFLVSLLLLFAVPAIAQPTFCTDKTVTDLALPDGVDSLPASLCFMEGPNGVMVSERFTGDGFYLDGIGFWFAYFNGVPAEPLFNVKIFSLDVDGCWTGEPLYSVQATVIDIGPGTGTVADPVEYFVDFNANDSSSFPKEAGVEYALVIQNANCPVNGSWEGVGAVWVTAAGDGVHGCVFSLDFGIPLMPLDGAGYPWDLASYHCQDNIVPTHQMSWGLMKSFYR